MATETPKHAPKTEKENYLYELAWATANLGDVHNLVVINCAAHNSMAPSAVEDKVKETIKHLKKFSTAYAKQYRRPNMPVKKVDGDSWIQPAA